MLQLPSLSWRPSPNYSSRGGARVRLCVIHDCEGSYGGSIDWFSQARARVSAHIVLSEDGLSATQMVAWANKAWAVCDFNPVSESYEAAGFSAKGLGAPEWRSLAAITAYRLKILGLPPIYAKGGLGEGFCQHADLGAAGGGHHDVTSDSSVWDDFVSLVQAAYLQSKPMPDAWAVGPAPQPPVVAPAGYVPSAAPRHDLAPPSLEWVQMQLNALGFGHPALSVDGLDGPRTQAAVASFQSAKKLFVDGDAGPQTVAALLAA